MDHRVYFILQIQSIGRQDFDSKLDKTNFIVIFVSYYRNIIRLIIHQDSVFMGKLYGPLNLLITLSENIDRTANPQYDLDVSFISSWSTAVF